MLHHFIGCAQVLCSETCLIRSLCNKVTCLNQPTTKSPNVSFTCKVTFLMQPPALIKSENSAPYPSRLDRFHCTSSGPVLHRTCAFNDKHRLPYPKWQNPFAIDLRSTLKQCF